MAASSLQGTGNQPYTPARVDYLASYLQTLLPGMTHETAVKWISAERGVNGNVLGLTYTDASTGKQRLFTYSSQEAGLQAAAQHVNRSPSYRGIVASLATGDTEKQLIAIIQSPWNARNSPYYQRVFGIHIAGTASSPTPTATLASDVTTVSSKTGTNTTLAALLGLDPNMVIDVNNLRDMIKRVSALNLDPTVRANLLNSLGDIGVGFAHGAGSIKAGDIVINSSGNAQNGSNIFVQAEHVFGFVLDPENWALIGAIVIGVPLALFGFYLLAGVPTGGANA